MNFLKTLPLFPRIAYGTAAVFLWLMLVSGTWIILSPQPLPITRAVEAASNPKLELWLFLVSLVVGALFMVSVNITACLARVTHATPKVLGTKLGIASVFFAVSGYLTACAAMFTPFPLLVLIGAAICGLVSSFLHNIILDNLPDEAFDSLPAKTRRLQVPKADELVADKVDATTSG